MKLGTVILLSAVLVGIAGCGSGSTAPQKPSSSAASTDKYPLDTCVVSGEKLGTMGEPFVIQYKGKTVKLCCSSCLKDFNKDSAKYMAILEEAEKKPSPSATTEMRPQH